MEARAVGGGSMPRRKAGYDDPDWQEAAAHTGEMMQGSIHELRSADPPGRPYEPKRGPLGFCIDPAAYRADGRRRRVASRRRTDT
jgi:hypothetical protein